MENELKRGIEIRKSIRLPTKRMAPAPPLPPRSSAADDSGAPPTSLRQLLGHDNHNNHNNTNDSAGRGVPHPSSSVEVADTANDGDKRQLAVRTDGGGIAAAAAPPATATKLVVDDGVHELNLKNLRIATTGGRGGADNDKATQNNNSIKMISGQPTHKPPPAPVLSSRKMLAPLSPSLVRRISSLNSQQGVKKATTPNKAVGGTTASVVTSSIAAQPPIKLSDLDGLVKRRDYVNQEATAGVAPLRMSPATTTKRAAIPEDIPPLTSIDVLNQIQQQITEMEVKHQEHQFHGDADDDAEDVARYKERIKQSKRYGEKEELSLKHGTSDVASNQLLGYLGDYRDNVRPSTETDDEVDRGSEDEGGHHAFQRGSSVRKSTGGAVMATKTMAGGATHGKGKPVSRTASDTKNLETKIKMMREAAAHHGPIEAAAAAAAATAARRAKPVSNKLPFSFKPRILDMNEKHLVHQVTPPSAVVASSATSGPQHHQHNNRAAVDKSKVIHSAAVTSPVQARVQSVQSHAKKMEQQVMSLEGGFRVLETEKNPCSLSLSLFVVTVDLKGVV